MTTTNIPGPGFQANPIKITNKNNPVFEAEIILSRDLEGWILSVSSQSMRVYANMYAPEGTWEIRLWPQLTPLSYLYAQKLASHMATEFTQMKLARQEMSQELTEAQRNQTNGIIFRGNCAKVKKTIESLQGVAHTFAKNITSASPLQKAI